MNDGSAQSFFREWKDGRLPSVHTPFVPVAVGQKVVPAPPVGPLYLNLLIHRFLTRRPCGDRLNIEPYVAQHLKSVESWHSLQRHRWSSSLLDGDLRGSSERAGRKLDCAAHVQRGA